jgi:hypothetical protein
MVTPLDGEVRMPKGKNPLQEAEVALLAAWIQQGAIDDTPPGTPHSCGSGTGIVRICRLKPAFRHRIAWGGELDAALLPHPQADYFAPRDNALS